MISHQVNPMDRFSATLAILAALLGRVAAVASLQRDRLTHVRHGDSSTTTLHRHASQNDRRRLAGYEHPNFQYSCPNECQTNEFCGRDLECHSISCPEFFQFGHVDFTGLEDPSLQSLTCTDIENPKYDRAFHRDDSYACFDSSVPVALAYDGNCTARTSICAGGTMNPHVQMNRKCTARLEDEDVTFICYDLSPDTVPQTFFANYLKGVKEVDASPECGLHHRVMHTESVMVPSPDEENAWRHQSFVFGGDTQLQTFDGTFLPSSIYVDSKVGVNELLSDDLHSCDPGCFKTEFCGTDQQCHGWSCEAYYEFGPLAFTGVKDGSSPSEESELTCRSSWSEGETRQCSNTDTGFPVALVASCDREYVTHFYPEDGCGIERGLGAIDLYSHATGLIADPMDGRYTTMNRVCTAKPNAGQKFKCFDIDNAALIDPVAYFQDFMDAMTANPTCEGLYFLGAGNVTRSDLDLSLNSFACANRAGGNRDCSLGFANTFQGKVPLSFDPELASYNIFSTLEGESPNINASPTSTSPTSGAWPHSSCFLLILTAVVHSLASLMIERQIN